ncbi:HAD family hydrolase [Sulfitobacter sp. 20_GPM-1509m]|uniref:HAD-IIIC family phosphatase n=1 Tax=Sulfitobacter sp. 20_GPM-1509m TaxID=1380367 RepID=UPI0006882EB1|nr:HAD-IIIC family phosphatase [Sulfitobacter sp. 20_GPM-1509m]
MSTSLYLDLEWLPKPPADISARFKALRAQSAQSGAELRHLAGFGLSELQLTRLASALDRAIETGADLSPLAPLKVAVVSNTTTEFLNPVIAATGLRHGFALSVVPVPFGQVMQELLDPASSVYAADPDVILLALDHRGWPLAAAHGDAKEAEAALTGSLAQLDTIIASVEQNSRAVLMVQTVVRPADTDFGSLDLAVPGTWRRQVGAFNQALADRLAGTPHLLLDVAGIAETIGLANWHDPGMWHLARVSCANRVLPLYADHVGRVLAAWKGKARRCLILDLDNTVWSGVIGDDGLDGIRLAEGDAVGEAHRDVQDRALQLRARGVVLAVSSKNDDAVARAAFRDHPDMLLREDHIAVFQANWRDKATNITAISDEISLGLDAMAFLDDNPAERGLVREALPTVAVPELPDDPALYVRTLIASGVFEATTFSEEDRRRADDYQSNAKRVALQASVTNIDDYLRSLDMVFTMRRFDATGRARIAQLISKSNQFNLTTRRYSEADITRMEADPTIFGMQVRLKDRFADNGMISVVICRSEGAEWDIDTWLMSCRVLGRGVERAVLQVLKDVAGKSGIKAITASYIPTARNQMVAAHYEGLGFEQTGTLPDGTTRWRIAVADIPEQVVHGEVTVEVDTPGRRQSEQAGRSNTDAVSVPSVT